MEHKSLFKKYYKGKHWATNATTYWYAVISLDGTGNENNNAASKYKKENISYRIQLGIFRNQLPKEVLSEYLKLGTVETIKEGELTRYVSGNLKSYSDAEKLKNILISKGFETAFIISFHNKEMISVKDAKALTE